MVDVLQVACWGALCVILLPVNIVCLLVLRHTSRVNKVTKVFLMSLTFADLIVCFLFVMPAIGVALHGGNWPFGAHFCLLQAVIIQPHFTAVVLSLLAVNVERFIAISYPLRHAQIVTVRRSLVVFATIWSMILPLGALTGWYYDWNARYLPERQSCSFSKDFVYLMVIQDVMIMLTFAIYGRIACIVYRHRRSTIRGGGDGGGGAQMRRHTPTTSTSRRSDRKSATTIFLITLSALVCFAPLQFVLMIEILGLDMPMGVIVLVNICFASNGLWDALLYYMRNKAIKTATKEYFTSWRTYFTTFRN